ncbi:MarR family winged helix-turn-helix transcriptional regulator [Streptococcus ictaluri]|uniref:HTH marR-type domain-containing protein n=1 Tax=Streptococcus ictaluri 707-05 TaxID=764299 RepID=G5K3E6_9STRE|nr:MarR family winged helix-turn-helix transcriptional regulator [Streptococcus ictaluri]EHI69844.1 hypothetical protein STRIC_1315 [Streptococcus ictaluri 707-05]
MHPLKEIVKQYNHLFDQQMSLFEKYARQNGLQGNSFQLLLWIYYNPQGMTQTSLCRKTRWSKQLVHATIKSWLQKDYVYLLESPKDKRVKLILLTKKGLKLSKEIIKPFEKRQTRALSTLSEDERVELLQLMSRYTSSLTEELEK